MKNFIIVILVLGLIYGIYWFSKKSNPTAEVATITTNDTRMALVNSVSNLADTNSPEEQDRVGRAVQNLVKENTHMGSFKGLFSKCYNEGHDIHWIDANGMLTKHIESSAELSGDEASARKIIYEMGGGLVVALFEKGYEVYGMDGKTIKTEHHSREN